MKTENKRKTRFISALKDPEEKKKRRKELLVIFALGLLFLILTWIEFRLVDISKLLPFVHSVFFIGLVNFNIIVFLLLIFFIFRNIVKVFTERRDGIFGGSLKSKLIAAFVSFSVIPTILMFIISVFYINNSFDKWFSEKMSGVLKSSLEVTNAYYSNEKKKNYHFAEEINKKMDFSQNRKSIRQRLEQYQKDYSLDAVEYYSGLFSKPIVVLSDESSIAKVPEISFELKKKSIQQMAEASTIHHFGQGNLVRVIVPTKINGVDGALVVSTFIPLSLIAKMDDIASAYQDFRNINPIEYPIKSIYLIILVLMTLTILLCATWFGFYLARQLSVPLQILGERTRDVALGRYQNVEITTGSDEINELISNFNFMTGALEKSEIKLTKSNDELKKTLSTLDEHLRYIEVVLSNASTGVVSVDDEGLITMVNRYAEKLLNITSKEMVGKKARSVLKSNSYKVFDELISIMRKQGLKSLKSEQSVNINGRNTPLQITLTVLHDKFNNEIGKVIVFDDLSPVLRAQRSAAWTEVARRIAHEIKNPLTPIKLAAQRLQRKFGVKISDPAFAECTSMIVEQVDDLKTLVNEFSHFARLPHSNPVAGDFNSVVEQVISMFKMANKNIDIIFDRDSLPDFMFDPDQIKRVITNLIDNSISALENQESPKILIKTQFDQKMELARLTVADNGKGVSAKFMDRIFDPYVTTKSQGTGLGLAIVKRMIEDHNGYIRAFHNQPKGFKVVVELPIVEANKIVNRERSVEGVSL